MLLHYHAEKCQEIINQIRILSGLNISLVDPDLHPLVTCPGAGASFCHLIQSTQEGYRRCLESDRRLVSLCTNCQTPISHECHAGLFDTAVPMFYNGTLLCYMLFGQVCKAGQAVTDFDEIYPKISDLGLPREVMEKAYGELHFLTEERLESAIKIVSMLTQYILLEHMIRPSYGAEFERVVRHINGNLADELSVTDLCQQFYISKNQLYEAFRTHFNCTVGEYIARARLRRAELLLSTTELPIYLICEQCGIRNYQYFCRCFKKEKGVSPLQYRKQNRTKETTHSDA